METLDFEDFKDKFGAWAEKFKPFIEGEEMYELYQKLKSEKEIIVPNSDNVFRAFSTTNPESIKVIWFLMDPYPKRYRGHRGLNQATGIAMDCSNKPEEFEIQPSLFHFYNGMEKELGYKVQHSPSLEYLHEQGCMMYNTDLTCKLGKTGSHKGYWEKFQKFFLEEVMRGKQCIYVLAGKESERMEKFISPLGNYIFKVNHPQHAGHTHTDWDTKGIFTLINRILLDNKQEPIIWDKGIYEEDLPF